MESSQKRRIFIFVLLSFHCMVTSGKGSPSMSSEWSSGYSAEKCTDGNRNTYCYNKRGGDDNPYFMIEYPTPVMVNQVTLIAAKSYPEHAKNIMIIVTNDINGSGKQFGSTFKGPAAKGGEVINFQPKTGMKGKYVIVKQQDKGVITFAEVQVNPPLWRDDGRCGKNYPLPNGEPGQCDPKADANEKGPCCSSGGWCGNSQAHCKCSACQNYAGSPSMSSEWSSGYSAEKCMDGNINTYCYNKRGGDDKPFFMIEYPTPVMVNQVTLIAAKSYPEHAKNIMVFVTNDINSSGKQYGSIFKGPATEGDVINFKPKTGMMGKYVIVKQQDRGVITFAEVQINPPSQKQAYLELQNDGSKKYLNDVRRLLPKLLAADELWENEIGVAYQVSRETKYPLALLSGPGVITSKVDKTVEINGTVNKKIGKRSYKGRRRPTGLYAKAGDILTITIPEALVSKISVRIGDDDLTGKFMVEFPLTKATQKIGSPFGGLIIIMLQNIEEINNLKNPIFNVQIRNSVQAPYFVYTENTNDDWNIIKKSSAPWTVLRIPGQLQIYIKTKHVKEATDMEEILKRWKLKMDTLEDLLGIPLNIKPGEEMLIFDAKTQGGLHSGGCNGAKYNWVSDWYYPKFFKDPETGWGLPYHEFGHGYFYCDIPGLGGQWYADLIKYYMQNKLHNYNYRGIDFTTTDNTSWDLNLVYKMVSFKKFSKGNACGVADFNYGSDKWLEQRSYKNSYSVLSYYNCWRDIYYLPIYEFGWNVLYKILNTNGKSKKSYNSKSDRLADLMCKATEKNMIPLFDFYNIEVSDNIAEACEKHNEPDMIMKFINIANCVKDEDIDKCTKLPGFPSKTVCTFSGTCNQSPDYNNEKIEMKNELDLWGATSEHLRGTSLLKNGNKETSKFKENCWSRAQEMFLWCKNKPSQPITASFGSEKEKTDFTIPITIENKEFESGDCYYAKPVYSVLPTFVGDFSNMVPELCIGKCKAKSFAYAGVTYRKYCSCGMAPPFPNRKLDKKECDMNCPADGNRKCGGYWKMNVFKVE